MRKIIISILGLLIIGAGYFGKEKMANREKKVPQKEARVTPSVFTKIVKNNSTPINVIASGNLAARDRIEIYSEVQGIFEFSQNAFKPGVAYANGNVLIQLNSDEHRANIQAQKSGLYNQIVALLPDLRFDYPSAYPNWQNFVNNFDVKRRLPDLPKATSDSEKLFIAGKNISFSWYNIKSLEKRLVKYTILAPFDGVLTEATVDKGALVRAGQKLGAFINPRWYELQIAVNSSYADLLVKGSAVTLQNIEHTKVWNGTIARLNSLIDPNTQTVQAFVKVRGKGLREGMFLEAKLKAKNEKDTYEISRKLIADNKVFTLEGEILKLQAIIPVHFTETTAIVRGLKDGTEILSKMLPGAYEGMQVKRFEE